MVPWTNRIWPGLTEFGSPIWQAEADSVGSLSALPATAVGQILLTLTKFCYLCEAKLYQKQDYVVKIQTLA